MKKRKLISRFTRVKDRVRDWTLCWPLRRVVTWLGESSLMCTQLSLIWSFLIFFSIYHYFLLFFVFLHFLCFSIFWVVFHCLLVFSLSLPLLVPFANFVFALFLISLSFFHLFCWLVSFVLFLFLNVLVPFFVFPVFFSLCVLFCLRCLWLFQTKLQIVRFLFKKFQSFLSSFFFWMPFFKHNISFVHVFATL